MPRRIFSLALMAFLCGKVWTFSPRLTAAQQAGSYYVASGTALKLAEGDPARASYANWQVWFYPHDVNVSRYGGALAYARWGVIHAYSPRAVMEQLAALQQFERAYNGLFGASAWGSLTFLHPIGPIAVADSAPAKWSPTIASGADVLNQRLASLVQALLPSLENGEQGDAALLVRSDLEQVRNCLVSVDRFYDKLFRLQGENSYLAQQLSHLTPDVKQAEGILPSVRAALPSVKLPTSKHWMSQTAVEGSDGTVAVTVREAGSAAVVSKSWAGGDGSMTGTVIQTVVPYSDIGDLHVWVPPWIGQQRWMLRIQSANQNGFSQSMTSPERKTAKHTYSPVNLNTTDSSVYLEFSNPMDAQNAYTFFLYHSQRGS